MVVANDGSTDDSADVVRRFARPNLIFLNQSNRGAAASRNDALAVARGDFIQFLDADDLLSREKLSLQIGRLLDAPGCIASSEWSRFYSTPAEARFEPELVWRTCIRWIGSPLLS